MFYFIKLIRINHKKNALFNLKMTMKVGDRLQVQSKTTISESDMSDATWVIESGGAGDGVPFLVQFPCSGMSHFVSHYNIHVKW